MKKLKFLSYLFAALLMVTTVSCDDDDDDAAPNRQTLLTAQTWRGDKIYFQGDDVTEDFADLIDVKNATIKFDTDGTYTAGSNGDTNEGTWEFTNDQQNQILMDEGTSEEITVDVNRLSATELWLEGDLTGFGEDVEIRFVH